LNDKDERVSSDTGLVRRIEVTSLPAPSNDPQPNDNQAPIITTDLKKIGNLDIYADIFEQDANNPDVFLAKGNVMLARADGNKVLSVGTDLKMDYVGNTVESIGNGDLIALNIKYNPNELAQNFLVYSGSFTANASDNPSILQINVGLPLKLAGLPPAFSPKITLNSDEVILRSVVAYLVKLQNIQSTVLGSDIKLAVGDIILSQTGNSTAEIKIAVGMGDNIFKKKWNLSNVEIALDFLEKSVTGSADFSIPGMFGTANDGIGVTLGFAYGSFIPNTFGASISSDRIPFLPTSLQTIPTTPPSPLGALINKLSLLADNISSSRALQLTGGIGMSLTDMFSILPSLEGKIGFKILSGDLALLADLSGKVELSGGLQLFEALNLANARIGFGNPTFVEGNINLIDILTGKLYLSIGALPKYVEATGQAEGNLKIPDAVSCIGGKEFAGVDMDTTLRFNSSEIDRAELSTNVNVLFLDFGVRIDISDLKDPHIYVTAKACGMGGTVKVRKAKRENGERFQSFLVTEEYEAVMVKADSENSAALFNLTLPDGTVYTSDSTPTPDSPDVDNIFFRRNEAAHEAYYAIKQPAQGEYKVEVLNANDIGEYQVELWTPNNKPTITLDTLATDQVWDGISPVEIIWTDSDPDNNAEISLYYDTDNTGNNGVLIATDIMEDDDQNSYQWTPDPNMSSGTYYLYAKIDDRENAPVFSYSLGKLTVNNPNAPATPQAPILTPGDGTITVNWDANNEDNLMGYRVYLSETQGDDVFEYDFGVGLTNEYEIQGLVNGRDYEIAVTAINEDLLESLKSKALVATPNGTSPSGSPDMLINTEESLLDAETLQIQVENAGEFQLTSARVVYYQEATLVDSKMIGPLQVGESQDITFQLPSEITDSVLVKIDEVMPSELRTFNNVAVIQPEPTLYDLDGYVQDEFGNPVTDVLVEINDQETTTDENGYYQINELVEGEYTVTAKAQSHNFKPQTVQIGSENPGLELNFTASKAPIDAPILYLVIDDTGSMRDNINGVQLALTEYIEILQQAIVEGKISPLSVLLTFKDQDEIYSRIVTDNLNELLEQVELLEAEGGDDCAEDSVVALNQVAAEIGEGGTVLLATDAPPHEGYDELTTLIEQLRAKGITINIILTEAYCSDEPTTRRKRAGSEHFEKSIEAYSRIANEVGNGSSLSVIKRSANKPEQASEEWLQAYKDVALNIMLGTIQPTVTTVSPTHVPQGGTLDLYITAANANFNKSSIVYIDGGIKVNKIHSVSPNQIIANVTIPANTDLNRYDMRINTSLTDGSIETTHGIGVIAVEAAPETPEIISIASLQNGLQVLISGINTHFEPNVTQLKFADTNITLARLTVHNETLLEARLYVNENARLGLHDLTITTGDEIIIKNQLPVFMIPSSNTTNDIPLAPMDKFCDSLGEVITTSCHNQVLGDKHIGPHGYVTHGDIAGQVTSEGWVSSVTILPDAMLDGGIVTGYIDNQGIIANIDHRGGLLTGGNLAGDITVKDEITQSKLGVFRNVTLLQGANINGGIFEETVTGKGSIKNANFRANVKLSEITIGEGCQLAEGVEIGTGVRFTANDSIPEETDLSAALTTDGEIDFSTDVVTDAPSILTQINDLPDMQDNDWQLEQNDGRLEVMVDGTRMRVKPKRVKQAKRNRRAEIIIHGDGTVTVITAKGREILVEVQALE